MEKIKIVISRKYTNTHLNPQSNKYKNTFIKKQFKDTFADAIVSWLTGIQYLPSNCLNHKPRFLYIVASSNEI